MRGPLVSLVFSPCWAHASACVLHVPVMPGTHATRPSTPVLPLSECIIAIPRLTHANAVSWSLLAVLPVPHWAAAPPPQCSTTMEQSRNANRSLAQLPSSSSRCPPCWVAVASVRRSLGYVMSTQAHRATSTIHAALVRPPPILSFLAMVQHSTRR
jgi:hypothetical protein